MRTHPGPRQGAGATGRQHRQALPPDRPVACGLPHPRTGRSLPHRAHSRRSQRPPGQVVARQGALGAERPARPAGTGNTPGPFRPRPAGRFRHVCHRPDVLSQFQGQAQPALGQPGRPPALCGQRPPAHAARHHPAGSAGNPGTGGFQPCRTGHGPPVSLSPRRPGHAPPGGQHPVPRSARDGQERVVPPPGQGDALQAVRGNVRGRGRRPDRRRQAAAGLPRGPVLSGRPTLADLFR